MSVSEGETEAWSARSDFIQGHSQDWDRGSPPLESAFQLVLCGVTFSEPQRLTVDSQLMGVLRRGPHAVPRNVSHALPFPKTRGSQPWHHVTGGQLLPYGGCRPGPPWMPELHCAPPSSPFSKV